MPEDIQEESPVTQKTPAVKKQQHEVGMAAVEMHSTPFSNVAIPGTPPLLPKLPNIVQTKYVVRVRPIEAKKSDVLNAQMFQERCRQICHSVFFREDAPVRSLGFTSSIGGEGKSLLSVVTANTLASDSSSPVTLLEWNWEHPTLHEALGCSLKPGLAEWLRGECSHTDIRYQVSDNLTFIPAGNGKKDAVKLLQQIRQRGFLNVLALANELFIIDLPSIMTTAYGSQAAKLIDSLIIIVQEGVTPGELVAETCKKLEKMPVQGIVLNQIESRVPNWIRQIL